MSKIYYTDDICKMIDSKLERQAKVILFKSSLEGEDLLAAVRELRVLRANLYSLANDLKEADLAYDIETAAWKAKREAENGTAT